ncbi:flagellar export chaperone FlgN [Haliovirga abyssi]|uniref:Flagellar protein FlgN n=1 Tax=Haliovirga abyssi TaxID=2996794 RepID=A0AAU9DFU1_9FUSO|nr:flagellar export chaperone FlgN [Haliovirga abyssi]BDU51083.1 hypothetical protein HLVA_16520 [Haliovirga abyssi]
MSGNSIEDNLIKILTKELELYKKALDYSIQKLEYLINEKMGKLDVVIQLESENNKKIFELEKERIDLLGEKWGKLLDYIESLENSSKKKELIEIRKIMLATINEIKNNNITAQNIVEMSNGLINKIIDNLSGKREMGYNQDKEKKNAVRKNLLNTKI